MSQSFFFNEANDRWRDVLTDEDSALYQARVTQRSRGPALVGLTRAPGLPTIPEMSVG